MLYWLSQTIEQAGGPSIFRYITARALFAFLTAFLFGIYAGRPIINQLYKKGFRSSERSYGDINTQSKSGTPVMGGFILLAASMFSILLWCQLSDPRTLICIACMVWFFFIGAYDDIQKVRGKDPDAGLSRIGKYAAQFGMGGALGAIIVFPEISPFPLEIATEIHVPFFKSAVLDIGWLYLPFAALVVSFVTNAVNFTDGMDGLVTVPSVFVFLVFGIFAYILGNEVFSSYLIYPYIEGVGELSVFCSALIGACLAFLWFNAYPAEIFMGDSGSLMLGGAIASVSLFIKQEALFVLVGLIFVAELLSTLIQERYGLKNGRRIFYRAPLHHTLQHHGLSETKIVTRIWIISAVCAALALITLKIR